MNKVLHFVIILLFISCTPKQTSERAEQDSTIKYRVNTLSDIDSFAETLKKKILNSKSKIVSKGNAFYVSNNGNDSNDGKSPKTAWATLSKVNDAQLKPQNIVLFERGGIWRGSLLAKTGVTYSAYGKGKKPRIFGSLQNYSDKNKWKATNTPNIYVYDQSFDYDAGVLVFNEGEACTYKKVIGIDDFSGSICELKNDLEMYHNVEDKKIYVYSEENPADRFSSIEFCLCDIIIKVFGDSVTIDNLCIKYGGQHGIGSGSRNNLSVTNCEMGWIGGSIQHGTTRFGNAIEIWGECKDFVVDHCYIYQVYDAAVTHQYFDYTTEATTKVMENVTFSNNLIEYCHYSIEYFLAQPHSTNDLMKNILYKNNICRNSGYGWGYQRPDKKGDAHIKTGVKINHAENFRIENNIFDRGRNTMVQIVASEVKSLPILKDNIYVQSEGKNFGRYDIDGEVNYPYNSSIGELLKQKNIEENPTVFIIE